MQQAATKDTRPKEIPAANALLHKLSYYRRSGLLLYWSSFFILMLVEFLLGGQLSKILDGKNYSLYVSVLNTLPFYNVLMNIGLSYGILYIASHNRELRYKIFRQSLQLQTGWFFILVAAHLALYFLFRTSFTESLLVATLISYTYSYRLNINSLFLASSEYNKAALANMLQKVALLGIFLIIFFAAPLRQLFNTSFIPAYPLTELGIVLLYFVVFSKANYRSLIAPPANYRDRMIRYGKYAMLNNGLSMAYYSIVAFIIGGSQLPVHIKIIMGLCFLFFRYTGVAIAPVISIVSPNLTKNKRNPAVVGRLYKKYYLYVLAAGTLTLLLCRFCFGYVIHAFYHRSYNDLPQYFNFFALLIPLSFLNSLNATVIAALGKIRVTFRTEVACTALLTLFLIYNLVVPAHDYHFFYCVLAAHLALKFAMQSYSAYTIVYKTAAGV